MMKELETHRCAECGHPFTGEPRFPGCPNCAVTLTDNTVEEVDWCSFGTGVMPCENEAEYLVMYGTGDGTSYCAWHAAGAKERFDDFDRMEEI